MGTILEGNLLVHIWEYVRGKRKRVIARDMTIAEWMPTVDSASNFLRKQTVNKTIRKIRLYLCIEPQAPGLSRQALFQAQ